jgi:hypothetical protein
MSEEELSRFKETIIEKARKGVLDDNPLLNATHVLSCSRCKHAQGAVFLKYLKSGEFEFGKAEQIEAPATPGPIEFMELEKVTPIILNTTCEKCSNRIEARPISAEYLKMIIDRPKATGMYT